MKLILFGGVDKTEDSKIEFKQIEKVLKRLKLKQVLLIPFARIVATWPEWRDGWFEREIHVKGVTYLNAKNKEDIKRAKNPLVLITGGLDSMNLFKKIKTNPELLNFIKKTSCVIGESAGAKILGAYFRSKITNESKLVKGLNILKDTIVEPHYTERKREKLLVKEMKEKKVKYGIGIDCLTAMEFELDQFPKKYKKIGLGKIDFKIK